MHVAQRVSVQVASHTRNFPCDHGTTDMPSGCLPLVLCNFEGSKREGIFKTTKEQRMMSLMALWHGRLPW